MTEYKIEKGVPIPSKHNKVRESVASTLRQMGVGDSVVIPKSSRSVAYYTSAISGFKFTIRTVDAEHVRVWRIQ